MASYGVVTYGSRGDSVRELQNILNQAGYELDTDGVFGQKTLSAVRSYQQQKGLDVDGKVGPKTWEALTGSGSVSASGAEASKNATAEKVKEYEAARPSYQPSDAVNKAAGTLADYEKNKPGEYQSSYQEQIDALLSKVLNREKFSYDVSADPVYQQYKDQYTRLGNMAMRDTMGNAAALTGGYGNSYATTAGSQAYQGYLSQLNNVVPSSTARPMTAMRPRASVSSRTWDCSRTWTKRPMASIGTRWATTTTTSIIIMANITTCPRMNTIATSTICPAGRPTAPTTTTNSWTNKPKPTGRRNTRWPFSSFRLSLRARAAVEAAVEAEEAPVPGVVLDTVSMMQRWILQRVAKTW